MLFSFFITFVIHFWVRVLPGISLKWSRVEKCCIISASRKTFFYENKTQLYRCLMVKLSNTSRIHFRMRSENSNFPLWTRSYVIGLTSSNAYNILEYLIESLVRSSIL